MVHRCTDVFSSTSKIYFEVLMGENILSLWRVFLLNFHYQCRLKTLKLFKNETIPTYISPLLENNAQVPLVLIGWTAYTCIIKTSSYTPKLKHFHAHILYAFASYTSKKHFWSYRTLSPTPPSPSIYKRAISPIACSSQSLNSPAHTVISVPWKRAISHLRPLKARYFTSPSP